MKKQRIIIAIICSAAAVLIAAIAIFAMTRLDSPDAVPTPTPTAVIPTVPPSPPVTTPTPTPDSTPEPTPVATPEPTPESTPTPTPTPVPTPEPSNEPEIEPEPTPEPTPEPEPEPENYKITFIGGVSPRGEPKDYAMFDAVADLIQNDDLSIMNLESVLTDVAAPVISGAHMAYTSWAEKFHDAGIDIINLANSHVLGCGPEGYSDTVSSLDAVGIPYVGNREMALYISKNSLLIGIYASDGGAGSNIQKSISAMKRAGADLVIACLSWNAGTTDLYMSNEYLSAHYAVDCGADIVLGHNGVGVHYFETYDDSLIIYGLGEYAGGYDIGESAAALQLTLELGEDGLYITETACIPIKPGNNSTPPQALPVGSDEYNKVISTLHSAPNPPDNDEQVDAADDESDEEFNEEFDEETAEEPAEEIPSTEPAAPNDTEEVENGY